MNLLSQHSLVSLLLVVVASQGHTQPTQGTPSSVFRTAAPSVVTILVDAGASKRQGSAVAFRPSYDSKLAVKGVWLVTNAHVVAGSRELQVIDTGRTWRATVEYQDSASDIAIVYAQNLALPIIKPIGVDGLQVGTKVFAIGSPLGLERSISEGIISAIRQEDGLQLVQTTAAISPGSSGGALLDEKGHFLAVTTFKLQRGESLNFAIDANRVLQVAAAVDAARLFQAGYQRKAVVAGSEEEKEIDYIESDALTKWMLESRRPDATPTYAWFLDKMFGSIQNNKQFWGGDPEFESLQAEFLATRPRAGSPHSAQSAQSAPNLTRLTCRMNSSRDGTYKFDLTATFDQSRGTINGHTARVTPEEISFPTGKDGAFTATINRFSMRARIANEATPNLLSGDCVRLEERKF